VGIATLRSCGGSHSTTNPSAVTNIPRSFRVTRTLSPSNGLPVCCHAKLLPVSSSDIVQASVLLSFVKPAEAERAFFGDFHNNSWIVSITTEVEKIYFCQHYHRGHAFVKKKIPKKFMSSGNERTEKKIEEDKKERNCANCKPCYRSRSFHYHNHLFPLLVVVLY